LECKKRSNSMCQGLMLLRLSSKIILARLNRHSTITDVVKICLVLRYLDFFDRASASFSSDWTECRQHWSHRRRSPHVLLGRGASGRRYIFTSRLSAAVNRSSWLFWSFTMALSHTGWVTRGPFLHYPSTCKTCKYLDLSSFPSTWQVIINTPIEPSTCSAWTQVLDLLALPSTWSGALHTSYTAHGHTAFISSCPAPTLVK
jgi:hypothetical protein